MTLGEVQANLALAKAAYAMALSGGTTMTWGDRSITLRSASEYRQEITYLERVEGGLKATTKGHRVSLAVFGNE